MAKYVLLVTLMYTSPNLVWAQIQTFRSERITNVIDSYPMLSPDGTKIVFQSNRNGRWQIYVMKTDGSQITNLSNSPGPDLTPVWSPDGSKIVFASERDSGDSEIYVMNADGSRQSRLTNTPGDDSHPHWYPDGRRIIFNSARTTPDLKADWGKQYHELFSMSADGTDVKQITSFKTVCTYPSVSPDGRKISFRRVIDSPALNWDLSINKNNRNSEVFITNIDGQNAINVSVSPAFDGWPWWSPDGQRLVFSSNRNGPSNVGQLFQVNADGTNLRSLGESGFSLAQPNWSKDGSIYAYQSTETSDYEYGTVVKITLK